MMRTKNLLTIFYITSFYSLLILSSCNYVCENHNYDYVEHKEEKLALLVQGNPKSNIFIIYLHGGPGGTSAMTINQNLFNGIEEQYQVVYYDQRSSGLSLGTSHDSLLTLEQFVDDLDILIKHVKNKYNPEKLVLMGHSWGATLGTQYLLDQNRQDKVSAWIEIDGGHNLGPHAFTLSKEYVINKIDDILIPNAQYINEKLKWKRIKDYYSNLNSWRKTRDIVNHSNILHSVGGYYYRKSKRQNVLSISNLLCSDINYLAIYFKNKRLVSKMDIWHFDFTDRLDSITIPVLLLWGRYDGIFPVQLAYEAREKFDIPEDQFHIFEQSAHSPHVEETELFNKKVIQFIDSLYTKNQSEFN